MLVIIVGPPEQQSLRSLPLLPLGVVGQQEGHDFATIAT